MPQSYGEGLGLANPGSPGCPGRWRAHRPAPARCRARGRRRTSTPRRAARLCFAGMHDEDGGPPVVQHGRGLAAPSVHPRSGTAAVRARSAVAPSCGLLRAWPASRRLARPRSAQQPRHVGRRSAAALIAGTVTGEGARCRRRSVEESWSDSALLLACSPARLALCRSAVEQAEVGRGDPAGPDHDDRRGRGRGARGPATAKGYDGAAADSAPRPRLRARASASRARPPARRGSRRAGRPPPAASSPRRARCRASASRARMRSSSAWVQDGILLVVVGHVCSPPSGVLRRCRAV